MAHVMTYEELCKIKKNQLVYKELHYIKHKVYPMAFNGMDFVSGNNYLLLSECDENNCPDYNWNYRVWNKMPTDKEMDDTPWKKDPYT